MAERVIELKVLVLDELGDAINFVLAVVEDNVWIRDGDDVDHATAQLMGKDRPLLYANIDLELISGDVRLHKLYILLLLLDHCLKVNIYFDSEGLISSLALTPHLFDIVHALASFLSVNLQLFDLV